MVHLIFLICFAVVSLLATLAVGLLPRQKARIVERIYWILVVISVVVFFIMNTKVTVVFG